MSRNRNCAWSSRASASDFNLSTTDEHLGRSSEMETYLFDANKILKRENSKLAVVLCKLVGQIYHLARRNSGRDGGRKRILSKRSKVEGIESCTPLRDLITGGKPYQ